MIAKVVFHAVICASKAPFRNLCIRVQWPQEVAIEAPNTLRFLSKSIGFLAFAVSEALYAIGLIVGQRGKRKKADSQVVWAFMGQKVPMMRAPKLLDQGDPCARVFLKLGNLRRVQFVLDITGYQCAFLLRNLFGELCSFGIRGCCGQLFGKIRW